MSEAFSIPQRQSAVGIILIFSSTLFKILRASWAVFAYLLIQKPGRETLLYIIAGSVLLLFLVVVYSYLEYRRFLFYIDYRAQEFILRKGVFNTEQVSIPFEKIQQVNFQRGILQRIIGVYSLTIDTAGSKQKEITIKAISVGEANTLAKILNSLKEERHEQKAPPEVVEVHQKSTEKGDQKTIWTYRLSWATLFKIGVTSNFFRGFGLIFVFVSTIYNEIQQLYREERSEFWTSQIDTEIRNVFSDSVFIVVLLLAILVLSIIITTGEIFIKYYGLRLARLGNSLDLQMGLRTNTRVSLKQKRVQILKVVTNPVQKRLNLYKVILWLAGSEEQQKKDKIQIPGLQKQIVDKITAFLYSDGLQDSGSVYRPHRVEFYRRISLGVIPLILAMLFEVFTRNLGYLNLAVLAVLFCFCYLFVQYRIFRSLKLVIGEDLIIKKSAFWDEAYKVVPIYKLQSVTIKQVFWFKKRKLVNVVLHTAAGDIGFRAVPVSIARNINYCLYQIEKSNRQWM